MSTSEDGFLSLDDVRLEYRWIKSTNASERTLVFLHEGLGSVPSWKDFPEKLVSLTGYDAFLYSRESYGRSSPLKTARNTDYHYHECGKVLPAVLDAMAIEYPVFIGHSDGATMAIMYAGQAMLPTAQALVLMAPHVFVEDVTVEGIRQAGHAFENNDLRGKLEAHHDDVDGAFRGWHDIWLSPENRDWNIEALLPGVECPVLLIQGEGDQYGTQAQLDAIQGQCSGSVDSFMLDDCGHVPYRDQENTCLELMGRFIKGLEVDVD